MKKLQVNLKEAIRYAKSIAPHGPFASMWSFLLTRDIHPERIYSLKEILDRSPFKDEVTYAILHEMQTAGCIKMTPKGYDTVIELIDFKEDV